jgi:hypothetical protein
MSSILFRCIKSLSTLLKSEICNNVSFHSQTDFVEVSTDRDDKFPALIIRGPIMKKDSYYQSMNPIIDKNMENMTYTEVAKIEASAAITTLVESIVIGEIKSIE